MSTPVAPGAPAPTQTPAGKPEIVKAEAVKKEPKVKVAKPKKEPGTPRPRLSKFPDEHVITVLKEGAKARNAKDRFGLYRTGMTVKEYTEKTKEVFQRTAGQTMGDMRWDKDHGFIEVGPTVVDKPAPAPAPAAAAAE